ncbi:MAG TPA: cytochrome C, partial [Ideonella sp.]|nr:cytochrome C [Ideonella sp.]
MRARLSRLCAVAALAGAAAGSLAAPAQALAPAHTVPDTLAQRLQACTACHGKQGRATQQGYFPRIAGKPAGYLYQQLLNFRDGRRSNPAMSVWVEQLSDAYLREIAEHFAALALPYPPPQAAPATAAARAHGERLVLHG